MRAAKIGRRTAAGAITLVMAAGSVTVLDGPAHAGGFAPEQITQTTDSDDTSPKTVTATCPWGSVFAAGGRVLDGDGGVVLTAMVPNPALDSVTVTAKARAGHTGDWALTAYATCDFSSSTPVRTSATVTAGSTAEALCPPGTRVVGTGFRLEGPVNHTYVDEVAFGPALLGVRVRTGGSHQPQALTAYGVCKEPTQFTGPPGVLIEAVSAVDSTWPKIAVTDHSGPDRHVYAVGGAVTGDGEFFLSALVPGPNLHLARAEAVRASVLPGDEEERAGEGDGSVSVTGELMEAFH